MHDSTQAGSRPQCAGVRAEPATQTVFCSHQTEPQHLPEATPGRAALGHPELLPRHLLSHSNSKGIVPASPRLGFSPSITSPAQSLLILMVASHLEGAQHVSYSLASCGASERGQGCVFQLRPFSSAPPSSPPAAVLIWELPLEQCFLQPCAGNSSGQPSLAELKPRLEAGR